MITAFLFIPSVYFKANIHNETRNSMIREKMDGESKRLNDAMSVYKETSENNDKSNKIVDDLKILMKNYVEFN
jgi:hypothetical protein